jgi:menaquinone-dependent protoporphyrinogen oxidase
MKVLVGYASRHMATAEIATRIGERLAAAGHQVETHSVVEVEHPSRFQAFVLGSAVYRGHLLEDLFGFVLDHDALLTACPVWLFSSGPLGDRSTEDGVDVLDPDELEDIRAAIPLLGYRSFRGALVPRRLGILERLQRLLLPSGRQLLARGDFRDWADVEAWADAIAAQLTELDATGTTPDET